MAEIRAESGFDGQMEVQAWAGGLETLHARVARHFVRPQVRRRALAYLKGLLSPVERKNGWQLAEQAGERTPDGMQRLLAAARWDADEVRDDLRSYVVEHLADPQAVLVIDETGFLKKGTKSVGVQRQYSGTAGKVENCQIGVLLAYASPRGRSFIDRELYLPKEWAQDERRRQEAGVPEAVTFQTKLQLARQMLERAFAGGVKVEWVTGDEVYGSDYTFRRWLEEGRQGYVLGVRANVYVWDFEEGGPRQITVAERVGRVKGKGWERLSAGEGAKGPRLYDWACLPVKRLEAWGSKLWLVARRSISKPAEIAYYMVLGKEGTSLPEMARVAGMRWMVEESIETAKGEVGLDQYEVRRWNSWYRHITLAMLAQAFLTVTRAKVVGHLKKGAA